MATTLPPTQAPAKEDYAGDEINALILDPGSHSTRAGFAGEDIPKSVVPTQYGALSSGDRLFGENAIHLPRGDSDIRNPYDADGLVEDWDTASKLWEYTITSRLTGVRQTPPNQNGLNDNTDENGDVKMDNVESVEEQEKILQEYPLLITEPGWNPQKNRERTMEIAMEEWGVPAFFIAKTGQLAAYASGKASALVVDIGHFNTSVTALWEGMVLRKSIHRTPVAANYLNDQIRLMFASHDPAVPLLPYYMVKSKTPVDANAPSSATYANFDKPPKESFRVLEEDRVLLSFKESVVQTWPGPGRLSSPANPQGPAGYTNLDQIKALPSKPFEMPDGWNTVFGANRFQVTESYWDASAAYSDASHPAITSEQTIPSIVNTALKACDVDTRSSLLHNIVLTGAGSLVEKCADRLQAELQTLYPNPKVRVLANPNSIERKFGAWIGGSVLGSLGTFHQMWISQEEYKELGAEIVEKRCK